MTTSIWHRSRLQIQFRLKKRLRLMQDNYENKYLTATTTVTTAAIKNIATRTATTTVTTAAIKNIATRTATTTVTTATIKNTATRTATKTMTTTTTKNTATRLRTQYCDYDNDGVND